MTAFRDFIKPLTQPEIAEWLRYLRGHSYAPMSDYLVSSIIRAPEHNGRHFYFAGVNVENVDQRLSTHAEEGAIAAMTAVLGQSSSINELWVMGAPRAADMQSPAATAFTSCCGFCRQKISGFADPKAPVHYIALNGAMQSRTVGEILPDAFSFRAIGIMPRKSTVAPAPLTQQNPGNILSWLRDLQSWDWASATGQAVILRLSTGLHVAGVKIEDAAYTGTSALQAALAVAHAAQKNVRVDAVYSLSHGPARAPDAIEPLPLSSLQCLAEFANGVDVPVTLYAENGMKITRPASAWARETTTTDQSWKTASSLERNLPAL